MSRVGIVGAGLSGLVLATTLHRLGHTVTVFEASPIAGGAIRTDDLDGHICERAATTIRGGVAAVASLVRASGLGAEVVETQPGPRFVLHGGRLVALGPHLVCRPGPVPPLAWPRALREPWIAPGHQAGETVHGFLARRLGQRLADALADTLVAGICGGHPHDTEVASALPTWVDADARGGLWRGRPSPEPGAPVRPWTVRGGLERLVHALVHHLPASSVQTGVTVHRVDGKPGAYVVFTDRGAFDVDAVVIAAPPHAAAHLVGADPRAFPTTTIASVHLGWTPKAPRQRGFGWLAPSTERRDVLGALWVSSTLPTHAPPGRALVRVLLGGVRDPSARGAADEVLVDRAQRVLREVENLSTSPDLAHVTRARLPLPTVGHHAQLAALQALRPDIPWIGWGTTGLGLVDVITRAMALAV